MKTDLHLHAPQNWINDPVGFIYYHGNYHLFYQYFPYGCEWGTMHWRHAISTDLCHWQDLGIAIHPSKLFDQNGCFSGSSIEIDGKLYLYYTGVKYTKFNPENIHVTYSGDEFIASQSLLISEDGFTFDNNKKQEIIPVFKEGEVGHPTHTRDPKVWKYNDTYYMVLASKYQDVDGNYQGQLLFYTSKDAISWQYQSNYREIKIGDMWECPDVICVDGQYLVLMAPERTHVDTYYPSHARMATCYFDHETCHLELTSDLNFIDYGLDFYASQTTLDKEGQRTLVGWMRMPRKTKDNWRGLITYPRVIRYRDGHIYTNVHPNIEGLFTKEAKQWCYDVPSKISLTLEKGQSISVGGYHLRFEDGLIANRSHVFKDDVRDYQTPIIAQCRLNIYTDGNMIETYINDGEYVLSHIVDQLTNEIVSDAPYQILIEK